MKKNFVVGLLTENMTYKIVSLFIALILWMTILSRRDYVLSRNIEVNFITSSSQSILAQTADRVRMRISGPRAQLKKLMESNQFQVVNIDVSQRGFGVIDVDISSNRFDLPSGVKILGIRPNVIRVEVSEVVPVEKKGSEDGTNSK